jgi:tripartite-type tricarboxylate transporter receptor subunit TctC
MKVARKSFMYALGASLLLMMACGNSAPASSSSGATAPGVNWPTKPISIVVPASPGGGTDVSARLTAKYLEPILGKSIAIINTTGAGGGIAAAAVRESTDDHTFLYFHNSLLVAKITGVVDFITYEVLDPIATGVADSSNSLFVRADSDIKDLADLAAKIKADPGKITYAMETGGSTHLQALAFQDAVGGKFNLLDAGPDSEKVAAVMGGYADVVPTYYVSGKQYLDSGDFRCLGIMAPNPNPLLPDVKTARQQGIDFGFPGLVFVYYARKGADPAIIEKFSKALGEVIQNPALQSELKNLSYITDYKNTEETKKLLVDMYENFQKYEYLIQKR